MPERHFPSLSMGVWALNCYIIAEEINGFEMQSVDFVRRGWYNYTFGSVVFSLFLWIY